jgi:hypothetical protein
MSRDRDVRNAIQAALVATNAFDTDLNTGAAVWIWGLPEDYGSFYTQAAAAIVPMSSRQEDLWDSAPSGGLVVTSRLGLILLYRNGDPQLRDEGAELLLDTVADALNGQNFAAFTVPQTNEPLGNFVIPQTARVIQWDWQPPTVPERRINAVFSYQYIVETWDSYDVTP